MSSQSDAPTSTDSTKRSSRATVAILAVVAVIAVVYIVMVIFVSGRAVAMGSTVKGLEIGGLSRAEATALLEKDLGEAAAAPIPVTAGDLSTELVPADAGLSVDWAATVDSASGLILNPISLIQHLSGSAEVEPVTSIDAEALTAALEPLSETASVPPLEPAIGYTKDGTPELTDGADGTTLDIEAAADLIADTYFEVMYDPVALPMTTVAPEVSAKEAQRVFDDLAVPAVALPVALTVTEAAKVDSSASAAADGASASPAAETSSPTETAAPVGGPITIDSVDLARTVTFRAEEGTLVAKVNGAKLHKRLEKDLAGIESPGQDARVVIRKDKPVVVASKPGLAVDPDALAAALEPVLVATDAGDRSASVALSASKASFSTADAKALNIREKLSSFRQWFPPAEYRRINVGQAAEYLNGTILKPGETFSMNGTVKERTRENGYTEGTIISGGRFREELGGGVSIITTATWTAGFYAGLERVEQHPHGLYISRYEAGLEATVAWGLLDLKMRNDTGNGVLITAKRFDDGVLIEMWGTKKFDKVTSSFTERHSYTDYATIYDEGDRCVPSQGIRGFSIAVTRRRYIDGKVVSKETWPTVYKPTPNVVCGPAPDEADEETE